MWYGEETFHRESAREGAGPSVEHRSVLAEVIASLSKVPPTTKVHPWFKADLTDMRWLPINEDLGLPESAPGPARSARPLHRGSLAPGHLQGVRVQDGVPVPPRRLCRTMSVSASTASWPKGRCRRTARGCRIVGRDGRTGQGEEVSHARYGAIHPHVDRYLQGPGTPLRGKT